MEKIMKLAALMSEADKLAKELIAAGRDGNEDCRIIGAAISDGKMGVQIYKNLKSISEKMGVPIVRTCRGDDTDYPFEDSITIDGVKFFEILTEQEAANNAKLAV